MAISNIKAETFRGQSPARPQYVLHHHFGVRTLRKERGDEAGDEIRKRTEEALGEEAGDQARSRYAVSAF
jgi:hypothetical protein